MSSLWTARDLLALRHLHERPPMTRRKFVIFDLDNCLCDDRHRISLIDWDKPPALRWARYHAACGGDAPNTPVVDLYHAHASDGLICAVFTNRPAHLIGPTQEWMRRHLPPCPGRAGYLLMMRRPHDEALGPAELKADMLRRFLEANDAVVTDIETAYDDRDDVLRAYAAAGVGDLHRVWAHSLDAYSPPPNFANVQFAPLEVVPPPEPARGLSRGEVLAASFPEGFTARTPEQFERMCKLGEKATAVAELARSLDV